MLSTLIQTLWRPEMPATLADSTEIHVPGALTRTMLEGQFHDMRIVLRESGDSSSVSFPSALGLPPLHFRASGGMVSLRSQQTFVSLREPAADSPNGAVEWEIWLGSDAGIGQHTTLTIRLALSTCAGLVTYHRVDVCCSAGDEALNRLIATTVEAYFYWAYTREAIGGILMAAIRQCIGNTAQVLDISVDGSRLAVRRRRQ